jgi:hypothetical protein
MVAADHYVPFTPKQSFAPGQPNVRFAPKAVIMGASDKTGRFPARWQAAYSNISCGWRPNFSLPRIHKELVCILSLAATVAALTLSATFLRLSLAFAAVNP